MRLSRALAAALLLSAPALRAEAEKRVVALRSGALPIYDFAVQGFREELAARRVPFVIEDRVLPTDPMQLDAFVGQLRASRPDVVLTIGTAAAKVMNERGGGLPFVYSMLVDPGSMGLATAGAVMEARPGAQLEFIKSHFPSLKRVGVIHSAVRNKETVRLLQEEKPEGITLVMIQANNPEEMSNAIQRLSKEADCLLMISDGLLYSPQMATQIILQTIQSDLPIIGISPSFVKAGALAAVYPDYKDNGALAAAAAARYFGGASLSSLSVQWPVKTRFSVNLIVSQRLGIPVQEKTLKQAQEVVR